MTTSTNYINTIIADLERKYEDAERNYSAARQEWETARKRQNELLESDPYSQDCSDACADVRVYFHLMMKLDDESTALWGAVRKLKEAKEL